MQPCTEPDLQMASCGCAQSSFGFLPPQGQEGSPRAQVRATRSPRSPLCPWSQLGPAPGRTQTPQHKSPPCPSAHRPPKHLPGGSSASGSFWNEEKVLVWGLAAPLSWVSVPISSTADMCPWLGGTGRVPAEPRDGAQQGTQPPHPAAPLHVSWCQVPCQWDVPPHLGSAPSPPAGAFQGFPGSVGTAPRASRHRRDTLGTAQAVQDPRSDPLPPGHAQRTGCIAKGAAAAGVGAGRSCSAPRCPHFPAPQCPDRCLARQGTSAGHLRGGDGDQSWWGGRRAAPRFPAPWRCRPSKLSDGWGAFVSHAGGWLTASSSRWRIKRKPPTGWKQAEEKETFLSRQGQIPPRVGAITSGSSPPGPPTGSGASEPRPPS